MSVDIGRGKRRPKSGLCLEATAIGTSRGEACWQHHEGEHRPRSAAVMPYASSWYVSSSPPFSHVLLALIAARNPARNDVHRQIHVVMLFMQVCNEFR